MSGHRFRIVILIFALLVSLYLFIHSPIFKVTQIEVSGSDKVSKEEVIALSGLSPGINIFDFDEVDCTKTIESHPMIKHAEIDRKIFKTIAINIEERQAWAVIPYEDLFLCIDDTGVCFDKLNYTQINDYPIIITLEEVPEYVNLGQTVNNQAIDMVKQVWNSISDNERQIISEFHYQNSDNTLKIYTIKGTEIRFGNLDRLEEKAKTLTEINEIENDFEKQGKDVLEYVDIRFSEPVLKTRV
jgi:cell division protein FtsQ